MWRKKRKKTMCKKILWWSMLKEVNEHMNISSPFQYKFFLDFMIYLVLQEWQIRLILTYTTWKTNLLFYFIFFYLKKLYWEKNDLEKESLQTSTVEFWKDREDKTQRRRNQTPSTNWGRLLRKKKAPTHLECLHHRTCISLEK